MQMIVYGKNEVIWTCDRCLMVKFAWPHPPDTENAHWIDVRMNYIGIMKESWEAAKQQGWVERMAADGTPQHFCATCAPLFV